jgi:hypothetical protein
MNMFDFSVRSSRVLKVHLSLPNVYIICKKKQLNILVFN